MKPLQICLLGKYYPPATGGIETHVRTLAQAQAELGAEVRVFCVNHDLGGPTVVEQDGAVEVTRFRRVAAVAKLDVCPELLSALGRVEADVFHMHVPNPTMILALLVARRKSQTPLVVSYHSDIIKQRLRAALFAPVERWAYRQVRAIVMTSPQYAGGSWFLKRYVNRLHVLPIGIDRRPFDEPSAEDRDESERILARYGRPLWVGCGRMVYYKGFLNAVRALPHVEGTLLLIGTGPDMPAIAAEAARLGVANRVVQLGSVPRVVPYFLAADALWFPSNARSESFGLVQVEAMASGCPVINSSIPHSGVSWVSLHEESGLTVPVDAPEALAAAARRLLREPELRARLVAGARLRAAEEFDHRVMAERCLAIYRRVLADPDPADEAGRAVMVPSLP
jgi:rhamnosyl/mannosyltransferase